MAWIPLVAAGIGAAGSIAGGMMNKGESQETRIQRTQRKMIDELLASLKGHGPYSDLFQGDENAFYKSFVAPAQQRFKSQIAPQIQQQYLASGQQRGTALEDQLLRAGVDLNSLLDEQYMKFLQSAQDRKAGAISNILGQSAGAPKGMSTQQAFGQSLGGYLSSDSFGDLLNAGSDYFSSKGSGSSPGDAGYAIDLMNYQSRKGYAPD